MFEQFTYYYETSDYEPHPLSLNRKPQAQPLGMFRPEPSALYPQEHSTHRQFRMIIPPPCTLPALSNFCHADEGEVSTTNLTVFHNCLV